ncbi:accessory gland protein Acp32CD [Drosophila mojavensis]|uniref:Acp32CD n=1 Tax=Drosophila mojavensis TaxID=7230 RepID=B4KG62_DROMO|nr:accessory gland protein Acp32CD [Drosophila mojavensis]EDW11049.1 uncharacterized protein Dmoj_GI15991 [Drosophila mojavensis]
MRTRLSIRILALGLLLWQLQATAVRAQKYYMNFAFNNNNPNDGSSGSETTPSGSNSGQTSPDPGSGENGGAGGSTDNNSGNTANTDAVDNNGSGTGGGGGGGEGSNQGVDGGNGSGNKSGKEKSKEDGQRFLDEDDDDSDSHDTPDRRAKQLQAAENQNRPANDHSHHSSYEISIDDSFGGRYVRSIYESSESHGHSGSNPRSGSQQNKADSSGSNLKETGGKERMYNDDDYEEFIER